MKAVKYILLLIFLSSFQFAKEDCLDALFHTKEPMNNRVTYNAVNTDPKEIRVSVDSMGFNVVRRSSIGGLHILEVISNRFTHIDQWKDYHANGKLKATGYMTTSTHTHIGTWNYYSANGKLDSTVNYDARYKMSFCNFFNICSEKNLLGSDSYISFNPKERKWRIEKWVYGKGGGTATGIELQVDSNTIKKIDLISVY